MRNTPDVSIPKWVKLKNTDPMISKRSRFIQLAKSAKMGRNRFRQNVAQQQQNNHTEASLMATQPNTSSSNAGLVRLVPNVLKRIFPYLNPADNVNCHVVHWLIRSIACSQLHDRLAAPKNGVLLLKWPLCFHDREDCYPQERQFRYSDLLRYNVSSPKLSPVEVIDQIQIFLTGYEAMMLVEILAAAAQRYYINLNTFMADFSLFNDGFFISRQAAPFVQPTNGIDGILHRASSKVPLFCDWQLWAQTITAVIDSCAATLSHFLFIPTALPQEHPRANTYRSSHKETIGLADEFYRALDFDRMLSEMRNLQTLYMPVSDYENSFGDERSLKRDKLWPLVRRQVAQAQFLPSLRRMFGRDGFLMLEKLSDTSRGGGRAKYAGRLALPHAANATLYNSKLFICPTTHLSGPPNCRLLTFANDKASDASDEFQKKIIQFVNSETRTACERQQRVSVWGRRTKKLDFVVLTTDAFFSQPNGGYISYPGVAKTLTCILSMLHTRKLNPAAVRISLEQGCADTSKSFYYWDCMRQILPFFVADAVDDVVLKSFRLRMVMDKTVSTLTELVKGWHVWAEDQSNENDKFLLGQQYRFPAIYLQVNKTIEVRANHAVASNDKAEEWVENIEQAVLQYIRSFLCDAVDSRTRRSPDLSLELYQSLKRVEFNFKLSLDFKEQDVFEYSDVLKRINLLWESRAAKFEQRVACDVFADVLSVAADNANDIIPFDWCIHGSTTVETRDY